MASYESFLHSVFHAAPSGAGGDYDLMATDPMVALGLTDTTPTALEAFNLDELLDYDFGSHLDSQAAMTRPDGIEDSLAAEEAVSSTAARAFRTPICHWEPTSADTQAAAERHLANHTLSAQQLDPFPSLPSHVASVRLSPEERERVLSVLVNHCAKVNVVRIATSFPPTAVLDRLLQTALRIAMTTSCLPWLHAPTFHASGIRSELQCALIAYGAFQGPSRAFHNLGTAMPPVILNAILDQWALDNALTRNVQLCSAYLLALQIMFWSGNKRTMEIGESVVLPLVTIMRRSGMLRFDNYEPVRIGKDVEGPELEVRWHAWIERESRIRLVHALFIHDAQTSITLFRPPIFSFTEMRLPLPCADELWDASTPMSWKVALESVTDNGTNLNSSSHAPFPSIATQVRQLLTGSLEPICTLKTRASASWQLECLLYGLWGMVSDFQLQYAWLREGCLDADPGPLLAATRFNLLSSALDTFSREAMTPTTVIPGPAGASSSLVFHLLRLALNAPINVLLSFAGKEGGVEARRVKRLLDEWVLSRRARQALWHACQICRSAAELTPSAAVGLPIVAVCFAALTMWAYGLVLVARQMKQDGSTETVAGSGSGDFGAMLKNRPTVRIDGAWSDEVANFVATGHHVPTISSNLKGGDSCSPVPVSSCPGAVMFSAARVLDRRKRQTNDENVSQFLQGVVQVMEDVGSATYAAGFR